MTKTDKLIRLYQKHEKALQALRSLASDMPYQDVARAMFCVSHDHRQSRRKNNARLRAVRQIFQR